MCLWSSFALYDLLIQLYCELMQILDYASTVNLFVAELKTYYGAGYGEYR